MVRCLEMTEGEDLEKKAAELANAHWEFLKSFARQMDSPIVSEDFIDILEYHYKIGFMHGYKHGAQDQKNGRMDK
jgi:hypothetical protein